MQTIDIEIIHATDTKAKALGLERAHIRDWLFESLRSLNVAEPAQMEAVLYEIRAATRALEIHVDDVCEHFGVGRGRRDQK